jgi:hypothetical protein
MRSLPRLRHFLGLFGAGLLLLPLLQACGGRSDTEDYLFGSDPSGATGSGADGSGANASTGARSGEGPGQGEGAEGSGANGSGATGSGANGSGANGSGASGGAVSTGGKASGGTRPMGEAGEGGTGSGGSGQGGSGTAGAPSGPQVSCGDATCNRLTHQCCAGFGGFGCIPEDQECVGAVLSCTNSDNCPGNTVCCLKVVEADVGSGSQCKAACLGMGPTRERQLCSSDDECPFGICRPTVFGISVCTRR